MPARGLGNKYQGAKWLSREKRLAIYLRDNMSCVWCGVKFAKGMRLEIDHIVPLSKGGTNSESNLITSCRGCNSSRGDCDAFMFARAVAKSIGRRPVSIRTRILKRTQMVINPYKMKVVKLINTYGSYTNAVMALSKGD